MISVRIVQRDVRCGRKRRKRPKGLKGRKRLKRRKGRKELKRWRHEAKEIEAMKT